MSFEARGDRPRIMYLLTHQALRVLYEAAAHIRCYYKMNETWPFPPNPVMKANFKQL